MPEARVLVYDLEITPTLGWTYDRWDATVIRVEREPYIMCFAYKWLGGKTHVVSQPDFPLYSTDPYDDSLVVGELWKLLDSADIVIAHNADKFDNRVATERFLVHRLGPPSPYKTVDTLKVARRYFKNGSNSLDNLCKKLGLGEKTSVRHHDLWPLCVAGDMAAWKKMAKYNKRDVDILEELYITLRPYITNHPNVSLLSGQLDGCPKCGSRNIQRRGLQRSAVATYRRVQCQECGGWSRERLSEPERPSYTNIA